VRNKGFNWGFLFAIEKNSIFWQYTMSTNSAITALASISAGFRRNPALVCRTKKCHACFRHALSNNAIVCHNCKYPYGQRKKKVPKKKPGRATGKRCSVCNMRAASNRAFKCVHCGHAFAHTVAVRSKYLTKKSVNPVNRKRAYTTKNDKIEALVSEVFRLKTEVGKKRR